MPDFILDDKKRSELDSNIKSMLSMGASQQDVMKYADDFGKMFGKKKDVSGPASQSSYLPSPFASETPQQKTQRHSNTAKSDAKGLLDNYESGLNQAFQKRDQFGMVDMFGVNQFEQSREGKAGKIVKQFQETGTAKKEDIKYLNQVAPKAATQIVFAGTPQDIKNKIQKTGKVDDADIESFDVNHKSIVGDAILENTAKFYRDQNQKQIATLNTIPGFNQQLASDPTYLDGFYKNLNAQKAKELSALNSKYPLRTVPSGVASVQYRENDNEYKAALKSINDRYSKAYDAIGRVAASKVSGADKDPLEVGMAYLKYADQERYSLAKQAGRSSADRDIADLGSQIQIANAPDLASIRKAKDTSETLDNRFPDKVIADTRRRLGAELYKDDNWFANLKPSVERLDKAAEQLPQANREAYYKYVRPMEQRMLGTEIPQSGALNQLISGVMSTVEGTNNFLSRLIGQRTEADVARAALDSPTRTRFEAVGAGPQKARLDELNNKVKAGKQLTAQEMAEKSDLETYTDVRSTPQEIIDGSLNLAGQVLFQALGTKGVASGLGAATKAAGFLKNATTAAMTAEDIIAANAVNSGITMPQIMNAAGAMVAYSSSYDQAEQEGMQLYPNDPMKRKLYAKSVAGLNALTERIFKDEKVLDAFRREVSPSVGALVNQIASGSLKREALQPTIKNIVKDGLKIVGLSQIENLKETTEEVATSIGTDLTKMILSPEKFDPNQMADNVASTATTMFTDGQLVALFAGTGAFRANKVGVNMLSKLGTDKAFTADVKSVINAQVMSGELTSEQGREKMDVVNAIESVNRVDMPKVKAVADLSDNASKKYSIALANEKLLKKKLLSSEDEALKTKIQEDIKSSEEFRKSILDKKIFIDDNFNVVAEGNNQSKVQGTGADSNIGSQGTVAGKRLFNDPNPEAAVIENEFKASKGINTPEPAKITRLDEEKSKRIADAYDQLIDSPDDPEVQAAYKAMADETMEQFNAIAKSGVKVEIWTGKGEPYKNSEEMIKDVRDNKHMYIFSTEEGFGDTPITDTQRQQNALLTDSGVKDVNGKPLLINDIFRFVHDYFGHTRLGNSFGAIGEENAWNVHARMYSPLARRAMTTETRGQNSWVNFNKSFRNPDGTMKKKGDEGYVPPAQRPFADQKMALLPEEFSNIEDSYSLTRVDKDKVSQNIDQIKNSEGEAGVTMNIDGSVYTGGGLVVPAASINTTTEEITPEMVDQFVEDNRDKIEGNQFKIGLYKFPGSNRVSIDLNIITPKENRDVAVKFAGMAGQESIYDLDTNENIKTGSTGDNPTKFNNRQFREIANALANNRMPNVFGKGTDVVTRTLAESIDMASRALKRAGIKFKIVDSATDTEGARAARGNQGLFIAADGTIIIDKSKLANDIEAGLVVWHEAAHPVMNIIRNTDKKLYDAVVRGLNGAAKTNDGVFGALDWAKENYSREKLSQMYGREVSEEEAAEVQNDEAIVETIGRINSGLIDVSKLDTGLRQKLIDFVNSIAKFFGIDPILNDTDLAAFKKTVSQVADALKTGRDIAEVVGESNVKRFEASTEQSRISNDENPVFFENIKNFANQSSFANKVDFKDAVQAKLKSFIPELKKKYGKGFDPTVYNDSTKKYLSDVLTKEAANAISAHPEAIGWYDEKTQSALAAISAIHPEIETDQEARGAFILPLAVMSNGNKVDKNFELAEKQYQIFKDTKRFDPNGDFGAQQVGIKKSLKLINGLLDNGVTMAEINQFLTSKHRAGDLKYRKPDGKLGDLVSGELANEDVYGAVILGPKIGNGFYMNLWGEFGQLTMDRWFMRTWGRLTGTLIERDKDLISNGKKRIASSIQDIKSDKEASKILKSVIGSVSGRSVSDIANAIEKASAKKDVRNLLSSNQKTDELRKAGNGLAKLLRGEKEAPSSGEERKFIRDVFSDVQRRLSEENGVDITMADLQAVMWYPEKILYESFKEGESFEDASEGYTEDSAPDYFNAAKKLAKKLGVTDEEINQAVSGRRANTSGGTRVGDSLAGETVGRNDQEVLGKIRQLKGGAAELSKKSRAQASVGNRNLAPNGKPSNLNDKQYEQVRTPEFKNWFGDWENDPANASKVVDENGEPLVVYHGGTLNPEDRGKDTYTGDYGLYFTSSQSRAKSYTKSSSKDYRDKSKVFDAYLNIRNPLPKNIWSKWKYGADRISQKEFQSLEENAADGIIDKGMLGMKYTSQYVVLDMGQIKSATDNSGAFSTTDNRIQASVGNRSEEDLRAPGKGKERNRALSSKFGDLDPETQAKIQDDAVTYFQRPNKQTSEAVNEFLDGLNIVDAADYVLGNPDIPEVSKVWMAAEVAKRLGTQMSAETDPAIKEALADKQAAIYNEFAKKATDLGQAVQAFIAFKKDPNAVEFFLPKILRELKKKGVENISEVQKGEIVGMLKDVNNASEGLPKDKAIIKLSHYLAGIAPMKPMDVLQALWYAKILSGVTTQSTNFFANIFNTAFELPAVAFRIAMLNGSPMSMIAGVKGFGSGVAKGAITAADIMKSGVRSKESDKYFSESPLEYFTWSKWLGKKGQVLDKIPPLNFGAWKYVGRMLAATDALFSTANQEAIANMLAYAEAAGTPAGNNFKKANQMLGNTKENISNARSQATAEGFKPGTLQHKRRVIEIVAQGRKGTAEADAIGKRITMNYDPEGWTKPLFDATVALQQKFPAIKMVVPFARIVANLTENSLNYSPFGLIKAATGLRNPFNDRSNKLTTEERIDMFNKFAIGMTALSILASKVGEDDDDWFEITAGGSTDIQKRYELQKGKWRPYTITLKDGTKISYKDWPIAGILAGVGHIRDAKKYSFDDNTQLPLYAYGFFLNMYDKSLLSGLQDFFGMFDVQAGRGKYAPDSKMSQRMEKYVAQQVKSVAVSNLAQQTGRLYSELVTGDPQRDAKTFMEVIYRDLPMFNDRIRPIIDVFGEEVKYNTTERLTPVSNPEGDKMIKWLNENKFFVGVPKKMNIIMEDGTERPMNDQEYYEYRKLAGQESKKMIQEFMDGIKEDDRMISESMFDAALETARSIAYVQILEKYGFK